MGPPRTGHARSPVRVASLHGRQIHTRVSSEGRCRMIVVRAGGRRRISAWAHEILCQPKGFGVWVRSTHLPIPNFQPNSLDLRGRSDWAQRSAERLQNSISCRNTSSGSSRPCTWREAGSTARLRNIGIPHLRTESRTRCSGGIFRAQYRS